MKRLILCGLLCLSATALVAQNRVTVRASEYTDAELIGTEKSYIPAYVNSRSRLFDSAEAENAEVARFEKISAWLFSPSRLFSVRKVTPKYRATDFKDYKPERRKALDNFILMNPTFQGSSVIVADINGRLLTPYVAEPGIEVPENNSHSEGIYYNPTPISPDMWQGMPETSVTVYDRKGNKRDIFFPNRICTAYYAVCLESNMEVKDNAVTAYVTNVANLFYIEINDGEYRGVLFPEWASLRKELSAPAMQKDNEEFVSLAYSVAIDQQEWFNKYLDYDIEHATTAYYIKKVSEGGGGMIIDNKYFSNMATLKEYCKAHPDFIPPRFELMPYKLDEARGVTKLAEITDIEGNTHSIDNTIPSRFGYIRTNEGTQYYINLSDYSLYDYKNYENMIWDTTKEVAEASMDRWWLHKDCQLFRDGRDCFDDRTRNDSNDEFVKTLFAWVKGKEFYNRKDGSLWKCVALVRTPESYLSPSPYNQRIEHNWYLIFENPIDKYPILGVTYTVGEKQASNQDKEAYTANPFKMWESNYKFQLKAPLDWFSKKVGNGWFCWVNREPHQWNSVYYRIVEQPKFYPEGVRADYQHYYGRDVLPGGYRFVVEDEKGNKFYDYYLGNATLRFDRETLDDPRAKNNLPLDQYFLYSKQEREQEVAAEQAQYAEVRKRAIKHFPENVFKASRVGMTYNDFLGVLGLYTTEAKWNHCSEDDVQNLIQETLVTTSAGGDKIKTVTVGNVRYTFRNSRLSRINQL